MEKATREELEWAYYITREVLFKRIDKKANFSASHWDDIRTSLYNSLEKDHNILYDDKMNAYLEETVQKYLRPFDDYVSLTDIARRFDSENPSYLIQSWLRSRNTVEFLGRWEQNNNSKFDKDEFQKVLFDMRSPSYTLTPKKWISKTRAIGIVSKRGKYGGTTAHPFIACDFEMWNSAEFRYEILKSFVDSQTQSKNKGGEIL